MEFLKIKYKPYLYDKYFLMSLILGVALLFLSFVVNFYAGTYATKNASGSVQDLILSNIPVFNVDLIFLYGPLVLWFFVILLGLYEPKRGPFILKSIALFMFIRSFFIILTHIGPFPDQIAFNISPQNWILRFTFGGDLFFSAHTGLPYLLALAFWKNKYLRGIFLTTAIFFGTIVLLGHLHYSIDVAAAFFITYSIFHIAQYFFKRDWQYFLEVE